MSDPIERFAGGKKAAFWLVFAGVTGVLFLGSWLVIGLVVSITRTGDETPDFVAPSPIYVDYAYDEDRYISAEAYLAMADYQQNNPMPQNVQVLEGLTTQEINGYMMNHMVAGLKVNCTYCHSLENFALYEWGDTPEINEREQNKFSALRHLELVQDLNRNWVNNTTLEGLTDQKQPSGSQMSCAVCHNGQAQFEVWPADQPVLPDDFRLPLDQSLQRDVEDFLNVNGRPDISLDRVQYQQQVMYHMNDAMNVGCTHCHNSRYFPSREVPAIEYAQHMLLMNQYLNNNYSESFNGQQPSCTMCHQGAVIPPGAVINAQELPAALVAEAGQ
jgi:photosynthetic reaction center cytochrome c subunit